MPDEDAAEVDQQSQFLVSDLERNERVPRVLRIKVASCAVREEAQSERISSHAREKSPN